MSAGSPGPNLHGYQGIAISTKGRKQTSNCRLAHAMGLDCSKSVCQAPSRCQAELDPEDSNEHIRQPWGGNTVGNFSRGGGSKSKTVHSMSAVLSAKSGVVQRGTEPAAKACVGDAGNSVGGVGTGITFEHWPEGAEGSTQAMEKQKFLLCPVSFPHVFRASPPTKDLLNITFRKPF